MNKRAAIVIRGVTYASMSQAARALGVSPQTVREARERGTLDSVALVRKQHELSPATRFAKAVQAMFETDSQWSIFDLDGAAEFFAAIGFEPSQEAAEVDS